MASEMAEQPHRLASLLSRRGETRKGRQVRRRRPTWTAPSWWPVAPLTTPPTAGRTCSRWPQADRWHWPRRASSPFTVGQPITRATCVIAVSQSGQTPEIVEVVQLARASGARAIAITNDAPQPIG